MIVMKKAEKTIKKKIYPSFKNFENYVMKNKLNFLNEFGVLRIIEDVYNKTKTDKILKKDIINRAKEMGIADPKKALNTWEVFGCLRVVGEYVIVSKKQFLKEPLSGAHLINVIK